MSKTSLYAPSAPFHALAHPSIIIPSLFTLAPPLFAVAAVSHYTSLLMVKDKVHVLFLCTGNSCRSQMAEGWANHLDGEWLEARSAGLEAHGKNPRAISVMREAGVDISQQESKVLSPDLLEWADLVVTVCGHADEHCPALPHGVQKKHWPLPDPAKTTGCEEEIINTFRATRDGIKNRVQDLIEDVKRLAHADAVN